MATRIATALAPTRSAFQGLGNVVRFNWPFYGAAAVGLLVGTAVAVWLGATFLGGLAVGFLIAGALVTFGSLIATYWVYDASGFYELAWLPQVLRASGRTTPPQRIINVNAGFDELTLLLRERYPAADVVPVDFYDAELHTEPSIARARQAYPSPADTLQIETHRAAQQLGSADLVVAAMSAHEVRDEAERVAFFAQLRDVIGDDGRIVVVEHLRDVPNALAYTIGVTHFHTYDTWLRTFAGAGLDVLDERRHTPFLRIFTLGRA